MGYEFSQECTSDYLRVSQMSQILYKDKYYRPEMKVYTTNDPCKSLKIAFCNDWVLKTFYQKQFLA